MMNTLDLPDWELQQVMTHARSELRNLGRGWGVAIPTTVKRGELAVHVKSKTTLGAVAGLLLSLEVDPPLPKRPSRSRRLATRFFLWIAGARR